MQYKINYSEYMEYDEDIEASSVEEAKRLFEDAVERGQIEPVTAQVCEYKAIPKV